MEEKKNGLRSKKIIFFLLAAVPFLLLYLISSRFFLLSIHSQAMMPVLKPGNVYLFRSNPDVIRRGDIVAYRDSSGQMAVSRVVAYSGDTVFIQNGNLISPKLGTAVNCMHEYYIHVPDPVHPEKYFNSKNIIFSNPIPDSLYIICCDSSEIRRIQTKWKGVRIERKLCEPEEFSPEIRRFYGKVSWNKDFFGPYFIPFSNPVKENISKSSYAKRSSDVFFFLMNDNRDHALDSRYFGVIRGDKILGKYVR